MLQTLEYKLNSLTLFIKKKQSDKRFLRRLSFYSFEFMLFTYLPFITFVALCLSYLSFRAYVRLSKRELRQHGLYPLLPASMQNLLKNKSLFTLFSEIWFNSKVSSYVRDIVRPFLVHNSPEDVQMALDELPQEATQAFLQKGLLHLLPGDVQQFIAPSTEDTLGNKELELVPTPIRPKYCKRNQLRRNKSRKQFREDRASYHGGISMPWKYMSRSYLEDGYSSDSEVIESTNLSLVQVQLEQERYVVQQQQMHQEEERQQDRNKSPLASLIKLANFVSKIVHFENRSKQLLRINNSTLIKVFLTSSAALTIQSILSKRTRKYMVTSLVIVFYLGCAGVSSGTLALYVYKIINKNKRR